MVSDAPPASRTQVIHETIFGVPVSDPFRWLEDEKSPEVQSWMKAQDGYARKHLSALPGREALTQRFTQLYKLDALGVPVIRGNRLFYSKRSKTQEKASVVWRDGEKGAERVLLDPNTWSTDNTVSLGIWVPSPDGKKVAFGQRANNADEATLYVLDVDSGQRSTIDVITGGKYASPSWAPDGKSFIYTWLPTDPSIPVAERPGYAEVRVHVLGQDPAKDERLHPKTGSAEKFINGYTSRDGQFLFIDIAHGWTENAVWFKRVGQDKDFTLLVDGKDALYSVEAYKGRFYVMTNEGAPNQQLFVVDPLKPQRANWRVVVPEDASATRDWFGVIGGQLVVASLKKAVAHLDVYSLDGKTHREIAMPGLGTTTGVSGGQDEDLAYFGFSSFVDPPSVFKLDLRSGGSSLWAKVEVPADLSKFEVTQVTFASKDGTPVTMFIVAAKGLTRNGANPTLLDGYGGFNISLTSLYTGAVVPWLEAGGVFAVVNLRGGGEYGSAWHDAGKLAHKQNVFDDFAGAAQFLIEQKYTSPKKLGITGRSNGGLLMGAAMTQHPELFGAVICGVPLLDMVRYHLFGSGMTWSSEYGNATNTEQFKVLEAYSPYHHVKDGAVYPPLLMMAADHDDRVDPMHARKFVARVQQATGGRGTAWLRIEVAAGHGGADQVSKTIESSVDEFLFLFHQLGVGVNSNDRAP
jgi:prolyl oligopeptidase